MREHVLHFGVNVISEQKNRMRKSPEAGMCAMHLWNSKAAAVVEYMSEKWNGSGCGALRNDRVWKARRGRLDVILNDGI